VTIVGELLKRARKNADLTQAELGSRAGTGQGAISAYESGQRDPTVGTLVRLLHATGHDLGLSLRSMREPVRPLPDTHMGRIVAEHREAILAESIEP